MNISAKFAAKGQVAHVRQESVNAKIVENGAVIRVSTIWASKMNLETEQRVDLDKYTKIEGNFVNSSLSEVKGTNSSL